MASIDQIRVALAAYYDQVIKPTLPGLKGILYGTAVGLAMAKPEKIIEKMMPAAKMLGIMDDNGQVDVDALAREVKKQIASAGGEMRVELRLNPMNPAEVDVFRFVGNDVDVLLDLIRKA